MGEKDEKNGGKRSYPSLFWPVILITVGLLLLLNNLGVLDVNIWELWRLWPLLLVLIGLEILLGRRSGLGSLLVLLFTLAVIGGVVLLFVAAPDLLSPSRAGGVDRIAEPLEGIESAELELGFAAGQLNIRRLEDSSALIEGELDLATEHEPAWQVDRKGDRATLSLRYQRGIQFNSITGGDEWTLRLSPQVSWALQVDMGAGGAQIDLTGLAIRELKVEAGTSQATVVFPAEGDLTARIEGGVGALTLEIPEGMAARVRVDRGLGAVNVSDRFRKVGQAYQTDDWGTNRNRVEVELAVGVGLVTVREGRDD